MFESPAERDAVRHIELARSAIEKSFSVLTPENPERDGLQFAITAHAQSQVAIAASIRELADELRSLKLKM